MKNTVIYPSATTWISTRADNIRLTTENSVVRLGKSIDEIKKVLLNPQECSPIYVKVGETTEAIIEWKNLSLSSDGSKPFVIDMTSRVLEYEKWQTLPTEYIPTSTSIKQNNTIYYKRKETEIVLVGGTTFGENSPMFNAINSQLSALLDSGTVYGFYNGVWIQVSKAVAATMRNVISEDDCAFNTLWRVEYTTLGESVKLNVVKSTPQKNDFAIPFSQQQQIASTVGLGRNMQSNSDRLGAVKREVVRYTNSPNDIGAYWTDENGDVWRLTEVQNTATPRFIKSVETWTKNWSVKSKFVGVNREFRSWDIPNDITQRNLLWQDYMFITGTQRTVANNSKLAFAAKKAIFQGLYGKWTFPTEICVASLTHGAGGKSVGAVIPVSAFGFGNSIVISGKTKDNLSAGTQRTDDGKNNQFNREVYYCEDDGTLETMTVQLSSEMTTNGKTEKEAANLYPYCEKYTLGTTDYTTNMAADNSDSVLAVFPDGGAEFTVKKDAAEQINFTYQVHMLTNEGDIIIGSAWAAKCPLVVDRSPVFPFKVWNITTPLPQGSQTMTNAFGEVTGSATAFTIIQSTEEPFIIKFTPESGKKGICLTDKDNNILLAYNGTAAKQFYIYFTHNYKDLI